MQASINRGEINQILGTELLLNYKNYILLLLDIRFTKSKQNIEHTFLKIIKHVILILKKKIQPGLHNCTNTESCEVNV